MSFPWDDITESELKKLYYDEELTDRQIANKFGVTEGKVTYKRRKFGITIKNLVYQE